MRKKAECLTVSLALLTGLLAGCSAARENFQAAAPEAETGAAVAAEETAQSAAFSGSASYDTILSRLQPGHAYAFVDLGQACDVLLVADGCYDNLDGAMAAIDAEIYCYGSDGDITDFGAVESGGTYYPLAVRNGCLFFGSNHWMARAALDADTAAVVTKEAAWVKYGEAATATYYYFNGDEQLDGQVADGSRLDALYDDYTEATVISFTPVGREEAAPSQPADGE